MSPLSEDSVKLSCFFLSKAVRRKKFMSTQTADICKTSKETKIYRVPLDEALFGMRWNPASIEISCYQGSTSRRARASRRWWNIVWAKDSPSGRVRAVYVTVKKQTWYRRSRLSQTDLPTYTYILSITMDNLYSVQVIERLTKTSSFATWRASHTHVRTRVPL